MAHAVLRTSAVTTTRTKGARRRGARGFTLVEMSAVVVIVGVLAVIAVVSYRRIVTASHGAEATGMINALRVAEEAYRAETGTYLDLSTPAGVAVTNTAGNGCSTAAMWPMSGRPIGAVKYDWNATCSPPCKWTSLPVHVDGPVMYGYTVGAGAAGTEPPSFTMLKSAGSTYTVSFPASPPTDWFVVGACGDPDGDGTFSAYLGSSFTNQIFDSNDGN